jgi:hypothetical protein
MKWKDLIENWGLTSLKLKAGFLETEWKPTDPDKDAAWDLYVELLTRITTQALPDQDGIEKTALDSIYSIFPTTRSILKSRGRQCVEFTKLAVIVLNQIVRPFTAKWHKLSTDGSFSNPEICQQFRQELAILQSQLIIYAKALSDIADVEDLTDLNAAVANV